MIIVPPVLFIAESLLKVSLHSDKLFECISSRDYLLWGVCGQSVGILRELLDKSFAERLEGGVEAEFILKGVYPSKNSFVIK